MSQTFMKKCVVAALQRILAGEVIDFQKKKNERKERIERKEREKGKERVTDENPHKPEEEYSEYFEEKTGTFSPQKVWQRRSIPNLKDLGLVQYYWEREWTDFDDAVHEFYEEVESLPSGSSKSEVKKLIEKYEKKYPEWHMKKALEQAYEEGGTSLNESAQIQFYQLPEDQFGEANVGPSKNMLNPDESDLDEAIDRSLQSGMEKSWIVIYSDEPFKYKKMVQDIKRQAEEENKKLGFDI